MRAMRPARRKRREGPQGGSSPCGPFRVLGPKAIFAGDVLRGRPRGMPPASHAPKGRGGFSPRPFGALRGMPRPRAPAAQVPFMRGYEIVEPLKGPCRIVWDAIAGFPALADLLHGRGSRSADGRISCARGPAGGSVPLAGLSMSSGRPSPCGRASGFLSRRGGG